MKQILLSTSILIYTEELLKHFLSIIITENEEINVVQDITNSIINGRQSRILTVVSYFKSLAKSLAKYERHNLDHFVSMKTLRFEHKIVIVIHNKT